MRKFALILSLILCLGIIDSAQAANSGQSYMQQAQSCLSRKEYTQARYLFLQAYNAYLKEGNTASAIKCGVQTTSLYYRENYYKEAFNLCTSMEQEVTKHEQKTGKYMPELRFYINKERLHMYVSLKRAPQALELLNKIEQLSNNVQNDSIKEDFIYTKANYYYAFGIYAQGDIYFSKLISEYKAQKKNEKTEALYKQLISLAKKTNNATLVARTYEKLITWTDSVKAASAQDELSVLKRKYDESQRTIKEKEDSLSNKQYMIVGLSVVIAIIIGLLIACGAILLRYIVNNRKQKRIITLANENNEMKTKFIQNISAQMEPTLGRMNSSQPEVKALKDFGEHIKELANLENALSDLYETKNININTFCEEIMLRIKDQVQNEVSCVVNAPKLTIKANPEQLERVLLHLLRNAANYTPEGGKIMLDFKKRGAHTHQFIVTDTGCGIPEEKQENLFKPFSEIRDFTEGDGMGLPICSLIAIKMNGHLHLDATYHKGSRFILELHA